MIFLVKDFSIPPLKKLNIIFRGIKCYKNDLVWCMQASENILSLNVDMG